MLRLALIGKDVSRSLSPALHTFILGELGKACTYETLSVPPEDFAEKVEQLLKNYDAFNVTIPFKQEILPYLKELRGDALRLRSVNTVQTRERVGYNTDAGGFKMLLETEGIALRGKRALVLGAGGAGRSCIGTLAEAGAEVYAYDIDSARLKAVHREIGGFTPLNEVPMEPFETVINCTGVGMHERIGESPVQEEVLKQCGAAVELIYEPAQSEFLRLAAKHGKKTVNGFGMLFYQAYLADCLLLERVSSAEEARALMKKYKEKKI